MAWNWSNSREIGEALYDERPDQHPLRVRFTDLRAWVVALDEFEGDPNGAVEQTFEAIQMVWWEEYKEENPDASPYGR
jgi:FeS assembly protein IscX